MLEEEIKKLTVAIEALTKRLEIPPMVMPDSTLTLPAEMEVVHVEEAPEKKKRKTRKKIEDRKEKIEENKKAFAADIEEKREALAPNVTKDDLISELRANVAKRQGDEFAKSVFEKHQSGATMSSLREEHYEAIYNEIKQDNAA